MIETIFTIFHDFIDRLLVLIDIVRNCTSQIRAGIVFFCQKLPSAIRALWTIGCQYRRKGQIILWQAIFCLAKYIEVKWGQVLIEVKGHRKGFQTSYRYRMR